MNQHSILFATDFSNRDQTAFSTACDLASKANARLIILHVQDPRFEAQSLASWKVPDVEFARYVPEDYGVNFDQVVKVGGNPDAQILEMADSEKVDMIVLGTHGRSGLSRAFSGSVAEKVLRNADVPVMTVCDGISDVRSLDSPKVLVPVDFSVYGYAAIDYASKLAIAIGAELSIVHVDELEPLAMDGIAQDQSERELKYQTLLERLKEFVPQSSKVKFSHALLKGDPATVIIDYVESNKFNFIVLGTHGRTGISRAIMGSVAESIARQAKCPVISVKPSNVRTGVL